MPDIAGEDCSEEEDDDGRDTDDTDFDTTDDEWADAAAAAPHGTRRPVQARVSRRDLAVLDHLKLSVAASRTAIRRSASWALANREKERNAKLDELGAQQQRYVAAYRLPQGRTQPTRNAKQHA